METEKEVLDWFSAHGFKPIVETTDYMEEIYEARVLVLGSSIESDRSFKTKGAALRNLKRVLEKVSHMVTTRKSKKAPKKTVWTLKKPGAGTSR